MAKLRLAVMSDLHVGSTENDDTRAFVEPKMARSGMFPMSDLDALIVRESISADYLLLPGDTANKADAGGLQYGWRRAHIAAQAMGAKLLAASGNHDVVTHGPSTDRYSMLKNLLPGFPTGNLQADRDYWAHGWCVIEEEDHRFVILDSTADFPPYPDPSASDASALQDYFTVVDRGGLKPGVEAALEEYLSSATEKLNIALVHHHPMEHQLKSYMQDGYGPMRRGSDLVDLFTKSHRSGRWFVVHGHKHVPQVAAATATSANGPVMLCSGSFGAKFWHPIENITRNQFHIVNIQSSLDGLRLSGSIESYTWGLGYGWYRSERKGSGMPGRAGFGSTADPRAITSQINSVVPQMPGSFARFEELASLVPDFPYLMPVDEEVLVELLADEGLVVMRSGTGAVMSIAREVGDA